QALYLHMAALSALHGEQIETAEDALEQILAHERRIWRNTVKLLGRDRYQENLMTGGLETAVAAVTLAGGTASPEKTLDFFDRILESKSLDSPSRRAIMGLLR